MTWTGSYRSAVGVIVTALCWFAPAADAHATEVSVLRGAITIESAESSGSAFCIGPHKLLTAAHVTQGNSVMTGTSADGSTSFDVSVVREDADRDLALLHTDTTCERVLSLASDEPKPGASVYAIGSPIGAPVLSEGTLSSVGPLELVARIAVAPGSSGGPLIGPDDTVIGVVVKMDSTGDAYAVALPVIQAFLKAPADSEPPRASAVPTTQPQDSAALALSLVALVFAGVALVLAVWSLRISRRRRRPIIITMEQEQ